MPSSFVLVSMKSDIFVGDQVEELSGRSAPVIRSIPVELMKYSWEETGDRIQEFQESRNSDVGSSGGIGELVRE